mgnify:CR=1 FL=1
MGKMKTSLLAVRDALRAAFRWPSSWLIAGFTTLLVLELSVNIQNLGLAKTILTSSSIPVQEKLSYFTSILGSFGTNYTLLSAFFTVLNAFLIGLNVALLVFSLRRLHSVLVESGLGGVGGVVTGFLGIGCAACGSALLSLLGLSGVVTLFPFRGVEFSMIATLLLLASLVSTSRRLQSNGACRIPSRLKQHSYEQRKQFPQIDEA